MLAAFVLAATTLLLTATPASAHDELASSDPAADSSVDALPDELTLTYSAELLSDAGSTVVQVTDSAGADLTDGAPTVAGNVVTQPVAGTASGPIAVAWRVVSSDGHPISGEFSFVVAEAPAPVPTETTPATIATPTPAATEPAPAPTETASPESTVGSDGNALAWIIGIAVFVALIGVVVWLLGARARQQKHVQQERTAGRDG